MIGEAAVHDDLERGFSIAPTRRRPLKPDTRVRAAHRASAPHRVRGSCTKLRDAIVQGNAANLLWPHRGVSMPSPRWIVLMRIHLLGTGTPTPSLRRMCSGYLIETGDDRIVFDHGFGAHQRLLELGVPATAITHLLLSHLHYDH